MGKEKKEQSDKGKISDHLVTSDLIQGLFEQGKVPATTYTANLFNNGEVTKDGPRKKTEKVLYNGPMITDGFDIEKG